MRPRRPFVVTAATGALLLGSAFPAVAHPSFTGGATAPAGSLTTLTLAMAHGCGTEADAGGDPTLEVAVEVPDAVSYIVANPVDGYEPGSEGGDGDVPAVVTWTATGAGEPAPAVTMDVVVEGEPGDELYVRVFQGCDGFEYRWIGTPDEPADDPAVRLTLGEPDPDAPAPPAPEDPAPEDPAPEDPAPEDPEEPDEDPAADGAAADGGTPDEGGAEGDDGEPDDASAADAGDATPPAVEELPTEPPADEGGGIGWWPVVVGALALAGIGGLIGSRRKPVLDPTARDEPRNTPPSSGSPAP